MGKLRNAFRAWWNDLGDRLSDPIKLEKLNIDDFEKALNQAIDAATIPIAEPAIMERKIKELKKEISELETLAQSYIDRQERDKADRTMDKITSLELELEEKESGYEKAKEVSKLWIERLCFFQDELDKLKRNLDNAKARIRMADAEKRLGKLFSVAATSSEKTIKSKIDSEWKGARTKRLAIVF